MPATSISTYLIPGMSVKVLFTYLFLSSMTLRMSGASSAGKEKKNSLLFTELLVIPRIRE